MQVGPLWTSNSRRVRISVAGEQQDSTTRTQMTLKRFHKIVWIDHMLNYVEG